MDNNLNNNPNNNPQSQTWTDPITGESYLSGNPHTDIKSSRVVGASQSAAYNAPLSPGAVPTPVTQARQVEPMPQVQPVQPVQQVLPQVLPMQPAQPIQPAYPSNVTKFCEHCGSVIAKQAVVCPTCGCQVAPLKQMHAPMQQVPMQQIQVTQAQMMQPMEQAQQVTPVQVIVNNIVPSKGTPKDKTTALLLCIFLGGWGVHRFYEGRIGTGILWMFTWGLLGMGWLYDVIRIACASNPYYVK